MFRIVVDEESLHEIRDSLNHEVVLGRSYFKDKIEEVTKRQVRVGRSGRPTGLLVQEQECVYLVY